MAATSDAQLRAQKKYDDAHRNDYTNFYLKCNNVDDADIIQHLKGQKNKSGYLKELIRKDIAGGK